MGNMSATRERRTPVEIDEITGLRVSPPQIRLHLAPRTPPSRSQLGRPNSYTVVVVRDFTWQSGRFPACPEALAVWQARFGRLPKLGSVLLGARSTHATEAPLSALG
jgi:hypothetical protein